MRVMCAILLFPERASSHGLMGLEIISEVSQTFLYFCFLKQKDNQHVSLLCFMPRSALHSPSNPLLQVHPSTTTISYLKKTEMSVSRKELVLPLTKEMLPRKTDYAFLWASTYSQHGTS